MPEPGSSSPAAEDRLLGWPQVRDITGLSRTTAWRLQNAGAFPQPVQLSPGRVAWRKAELDAWKASRTPRWTVPRQPTPTAAPDPDSAAPLALGTSPPVAACPAEPPVLAQLEPAPLRPKRKSRKAVAQGQIAFDF